MTKHAFLEGMGVGLLAGAAIGIAVSAKPSTKSDMRRMAHRAARKMDRIKEDIVDAF